jgi:hypothetical protein
MLPSGDLIDLPGSSKIVGMTLLRNESKLVDWEDDFSIRLPSDSHGTWPATPAIT